MPRKWGSCLSRLRKFASGARTLFCLTCVPRKSGSSGLRRLAKAPGAPGRFAFHDRAASILRRRRLDWAAIDERDRLFRCDRGVSFSQRIDEPELDRGGSRLQIPETNDRHVRRPSAACIRASLHSIPKLRELTVEAVFTALRSGPMRLTSPSCTFSELMGAFYFIFVSHPRLCRAAGRDRH